MHSSFFFNDTATTEIYTLSLHDALPISLVKQFQSLEVKADADQQLIELKRKMGLLPAASGGESKQLGKGAAEAELVEDDDAPPEHQDRKSTRLNSSHGYISYAVFCLKKKKNTTLTTCRMWTTD